MQNRHCDLVARVFLLNLWNTENISRYFYFYFFLKQTLSSKFYLEFKLFALVFLENIQTFFFLNIILAQENNLDWTPALIVQPWQRCKRLEYPCLSPGFTQISILFDCYLLVHQHHTVSLTPIQVWPHPYLHAGPPTWFPALETGRSLFCQPKRAQWQTEDEYREGTQRVATPIRNYVVDPEKCCTSQAFWLQRGWGR